MSLHVLMAPDCRELAPYQSLLSDALERQGVHCSYLAKGRRRGLPVTRALQGTTADIFHLHWFDCYVGNPQSTFRRLRLPWDLRHATRTKPKLVYTVHDLFPTGWPETPVNRRMVHGVLHAAHAVIVHSEGARAVVEQEFGVPREKCALLPHGDQAVYYGPPLERATARARLGLDERKVCVAFGAVLPNKGMAELVDWWAQANPETVLVIVGHAYDLDLARQMNKVAAGHDNIDLRFSFLSDKQITTWFSAADCAVINYNAIFTSGVGVLARSFGVPILVPKRLKTLDLGEPDPYVLRYDSLESDFRAALAAATARTPDFARAAPFREHTSWDRIARQTAEIYRRTLSGEPIDSAGD